MYCIYFLKLRYIRKERNFNFYTLKMICIKNKNVVKSFIKVNINSKYSKFLKCLHSKLNLYEVLLGES